ncbi:MAG TPA: tail fiber protein [Gammaproteobacteria bacterium]|nr:tail fiber protein [Gammaproteobacteria bacterium]
MSEPFLGEVRLFAGNFAPAGWNFCDGTLLPIADNEALYTLLGTTYGGDGMTNFALPDLRGRVPVGQGNGPGLTPRMMGESFGVETVTLTSQQIPTHSHSFVTSAAAATSPNPGAALFANVGQDTLYAASPSGPQPKALNQQSVMNAGGSQPHNNIMSSVGMNYIIALEGLYPSQG